MFSRRLPLEDNYTNHYNGIKWAEIWEAGFQGEEIF